MNDMWRRPMKDTLIREFREKIATISENEDIYIFGAGTYGKIFGSFFNQCQIQWSGFIDNNKAIQDSVICEKKVYSLENVQNKENACVLIFLSPLIYANDVDKIKRQISDSGFLPENILYYGDKVELINDVIYFVNDPEDCLSRNKRLKNIFSGRRCFVIGNGPSLRVEDLNRLSGEITMGCNNLISLLDKITCRPTCFFCEDTIFLEKHIRSKEELEYLLSRCDYVFSTLRSDLYKIYGTLYDSLYFLLPERTVSKVNFSDDISKKTFSSGTTLYSMLQVAVYMGIKEIYLLGVDFSFRKESYSDGTVKINHDVKNHMELMEQVVQGNYNVDLIMEGYKCALEYANNHGIRIYNATRGGRLEVFERVNFDELF